MDESPEQRAEAVQYAPPAPEPEVDPVLESARQADSAAADEELAAQFTADVTVGDDVESVAAVEVADVDVQGEEIATPEAEEISPFKPREDESDIDRFSRTVVDVPLDIRPTEGAMPHDAAATEFERLQAAADPRMSGDVPGIGCSYTPWTICFRPLYFEEQNVERYGYRVPVLQSAISGTAFLKNVAMLPYHMRVNPPRSCVCSNGFSRIGDCRPANYPALRVALGCRRSRDGRRHRLRVHPAVIVPRASRRCGPRESWVLLASRQCELSQRSAAYAYWLNVCRR